MADFERIIKLVIIIMLQSSAIGVLSQSSAIIWLVDTMAELWAKTSVAELWSMMILKKANSWSAKSQVNHLFPTV